MPLFPVHGPRLVNRSVLVYEEMSAIRVLTFIAFERRFRGRSACLVDDDPVYVRDRTQLQIWSSLLRNVRISNPAFLINLQVSV